MLQNVTSTPSRRSLEFGIYRDGDNNLDPIQESVVSQALRTSASDSRIQFTVEDTTATRPGAARQAQGDTRHGLHTDQFTISDGALGPVDSLKAHNMSDERNLSAFVATTLDNAEASGAKQTWIDLVDHGGGDGGGLETRDGSCMTMPDIAKAISDGVALHAREHPEDAGRGVDGVVANQCLMDTMGFADALSHANVKWLAASPETMLAPGVPSNVAHAIASHENEPVQMAKAIVGDVMRTKYDVGAFGGFGPAAAFDVLDLDSAKIDRAEAAIRRLNDDAAAQARDLGVRDVLREDARAIDGMVRAPLDEKNLPWHADRPAIAFYDTLASDGRLDATVRADARAASAAVRNLVLAHRESAHFAPFGGADYSDAAGPTIHLPTSCREIDPWASAGVSETNNDFYRKVDQGAMTRVIA
ncbi:MAG: hypothetical protein JOZ77_09855 [Candidatus Eremiobacteraeota bacterium]|nr:hypothetical protein [Candidatus Eremiobacteraeota bacterium]